MTMLRRLAQLTSWRAGYAARRRQTFETGRDGLRRDSAPEPSSQSSVPIALADIVGNKVCWAHAYETMGCVLIPSCPRTCAALGEDLEQARYRNDIHGLGV